MLSLNRVLSVVLGSMRARIQMASGCPWHPHHMKCQELRKNVLPKGKRIDFDLGSLGLRIWGGLGLRFNDSYFNICEPSHRDTKVEKVLFGEVVLNFQH